MSDPSRPSMDDQEQTNTGISDEYSFRSRASSIISTGTKVSLVPTFLTTPFNPQILPAAEPAEQTSSNSNSSGNVIDVLLGRRNFRISARPGSVLSISSFDVPAPPYSEALDAPNVPVGGSQTTQEQPSTPTRGGASNPDETDIWSPTPRATRRVRIQPFTAEKSSSSAGPSNRDDDGEIETPESNPPSPPMSPLEHSRNAISAHYTNVVRTIDANHRSELARLEANQQAQMAALQNAHQAQLEEMENVRQGELRELEANRLSEIGALRAELLSWHHSELAAKRNEQDAVYRGEFSRMRQENHEVQASHDVVLALKDRLVAKTIELDGQINALEAEVKELKTEKERREQERDAERRKGEQEHDAERKRLEQEIEVQKQRLEKHAEERERIARNEVEDVWEKRWIERMVLAREQVAKADRFVTLTLEEVERRAPGMSVEIGEQTKALARAEEVQAKAKKGGRKWPSF